MYVNFVLRKGASAVCKKRKKNRCFSPTKILYLTVIE